MADITTSDAVPRRSGNGAYLLAWSAVGGLAAFYLAALALKPELVHHTGNALGAGSTTPQPAAEVEGLRRSLLQAQADAKRAESAAARTAAEKRSVELRLAALEEQLAAASKAAAQAQPPAPGASAAAPVAPQAPAPPARVPARVVVTAPGAGGSIPVEIVNAKPQQPAAEAPSAAAAAPVTLSATPAVTPATTPAAPIDNVAVPLPARRPAALRLKTSAVSSVSIATEGPPASTGQSIVTGSIARPAVPSFGAPVVTRNAPETVGVRLSSGPSVDALRLAWSLLTERHAADLAALEPRYVAGGSAAAPFELMAGPLPSPAAAAALCDRLAAQGIVCNVGAFTGNAL